MAALCRSTPDRLNPLAPFHFGDFLRESHPISAVLNRFCDVLKTRLSLVGSSRSNRNGLGATVRVHAASQTYTKYNDGKSGYLSQSVLPLYFGLGEATKIDRVDVDWPSGQKQVVTSGLEENQVLRITEPK